MQKLYSSLRLRGVFSGLVKFGFVSLNTVFLLQTRARHKVSSFLFFVSLHCTVHTLDLKRGIINLI